MNCDHMNTEGEFLTFRISKSKKSFMCTACGRWVRFPKEERDTPYVVAVFASWSYYIQKYGMGRKL